jgi:ParB-like chromosome segregation protein Spo0J
MRVKILPVGQYAKLEFHEVCREYDDFTPEEYDRLREDIRTKGLLVPIVIWRGQVVDGRHRFLICKELGAPLKTEDVTEACPSEEMMRARVASLNQHRRSRTRPVSNSEKHERTRYAIIKNPTLSDQAIAEQVGVSRPKVTAVRKELEAEGVVKFTTPADRKSRRGKKGEGAKRTTAARRGKNTTTTTASGEDAMGGKSLDELAVTGEGEGDGGATTTTDTDTESIVESRAESTEAADRDGNGDASTTVEVEAEVQANGNASANGAKSDDLAANAVEAPPPKSNYAKLVEAWPGCTAEEQCRFLNQNGAVILNSDEGLQQLRGLYVAALRDRDAQQRRDELRGLAAAFGIAEAIPEFLSRKPGTKLDDTPPSDDDALN